MIDIFDDILKAIENLPVLLQYFLPGFLAVSLFRFFCSKKLDTKVIFITSCLLSYLSLAILSLFIELDNALVASGISFVCLIGLTIIFSFIYKTNWFKKLLVTLFNKTPNNSIWDDVIDFKKGSNLKIYFKNKDYYMIGHSKTFEENGEDSWFAVSAFGTYDIETNQPINTQYLDKPNIITTFRISDVEHIEIF